ncbi:MULTISPECIES: DNA topoisomerase [Coprococcus]|uniref:DNA topoisomerase n=1 Tax=Coprococcus eutactus TaxID=33043 RepID=A0AAI9K144_9FIRM|nr:MULTISPECIES: DNA topoisomerase [Coprococcus]MCU6722464.1 DNA topoisomerase [Coprococcus aceti]GFO93669.1 DNA topoisomerase [Coprococcus eutactus]CUO09069.1 DNA topoisomerase 3 [Coprococcus eutactus]
MKNLYIAEKPSVARQFADVLGVKGNAGNGYLESDTAVVTWCVGHLVTMSYPEVYDPNLKKWSLSTIPFIPTEYKYEVLPDTKKQFNIVAGLLNRDDIGCIYVATDSGREGEYIYRLVDSMAHVTGKEKRRVWIDSQTEEEILRGIREAKPLSEYDSLSDAAYLRAQEDYLMGINFSRALSLKFSNVVQRYLGMDRCVIAVGRVMTCVLGIIVKREREIREFVKTPFYRLVANVGEEGQTFDAEWKAVKGTKYFESPLLYKENGFKERPAAEQLLAELKAGEPEAVAQAVERKKEKKQPPMLYNLAELQNDCSSFFKISPSDTLKIVQELYEKKLVTYPRTDARVLSTAVAKEIGRNISGLKNFQPVAEFAQGAMESGTYKGIAKTKYVNDKQITDHYAIIPTGQGFGALRSLAPTALKVYEIICRRFLSIFYPAAEYQKVAMTLSKNGEKLFANFKYLINDGYLKVAANSFSKKKDDVKYSPEFIARLAKIKKGDKLSVQGIDIKEGETSPPKRYNSGSLILTMENAGQFIEDEALREQIKGAGIGTSATRDGIITKLEKNKYISLNKKTQIVTPTFLGEIIYDIVYYSINGLLRADLTASWEKGLEGVAEGQISKQEYTDKMTTFVTKYTNLVKQIQNQNGITGVFDKTKVFYAKGGGAQKKETRATARTGAKAEKNADTQ